MFNSLAISNILIKLQTQKYLAIIYNCQFVKNWWAPLDHYEPQTSYKVKKKSNKWIRRKVRYVIVVLFAKFGQNKSFPEKLSSLTFGHL